MSLKSSIHARHRGISLGASVAFPCLLVLAACSKPAPPAPVMPAKSDVHAMKIATGPAQPTAKPVCPSSFNIPARPQDAPVDDVRGIRPGTSLDDAILYFRCQYPELEFNKPVNRTLAQGMNMRGVRGENDGINDWSGLDFHERQIRVRFDLKAPGLRYRFRSFGEEGQEIVYGIWQDQNFETDKPSVDKARDDLIAKYGKPGKLEDNPGETLIEWKFNSGGIPLNAKSEEFRHCDASGRSWGEGCGLTIMARMYKDHPNNLLARSLEVGVFEQGKFSNEGRRFEKLWKVDSARKNAEAAAKASTGSAKF